MSNVPSGLHFTKEHEWVREVEGMLEVGISDYAQSSLGDIVFVDLKSVGTKLDRGQAFGTVESVKAAEDLYCPASSTIAEVNVSLKDDPALVNRQPYAAWMVRLKDFKKEDLANLMSASAYEEYLKTIVH